MEKIIKIFLCAILASVLYQVGFALIHANQGDTVTIQSRFTKVEDGKKVFNWAGVFTPTQVTAFKTTEKVTNFTERVTYPVAPKFDLVAPSDSKEDVVASKISKVIQDSLRKITYNNALNYDGTSFAVLQASGDSMPVVSKPQIVLSLIGTASPEAKKYGFRESMEPGCFEVENQKLAEARLDRTQKLLSEKLAKTNFRITKTEAKEIQFQNEKEVASAVADPTLLNAMRYVEAKVIITSQNVKVIPCPSPILLLLWLGALYFLLSYLSRIKWAEPQVPVIPVRRVATIARVEEPKEEVYNFNFVWFLLGAGTLYILYQWLGWRAILFAGILAMAYGLYYLLKKSKQLVYVPQEKTVKEKTPRSWIFAEYIGWSIAGLCIIGIILVSSSWLLRQEVVLWILFAVLVSLMSYIIYFYQEPIRNYFRGWKLPKPHMRVPKITFPFTEVLLWILALALLGAIWYWLGLKTLLLVLVATIIIIMIWLLRFAPKPNVKRIFSIFEEAVIWIRFMAIHWWHWSPKCCKILLAIIIITRLLGWWVWTGPWFW